jgi:hypothetical protein
VHSAHEPQSQSQEPGGLAELAAICTSPEFRRLARRLAGDFAEDVLQDTYYLVARVCRREPIDNLPGYCYRTLANQARRLGRDLAQGPVPTDDPEAARGTSHGHGDTLGGHAPSAEAAALARVVAQERLDRLRRLRAELRAGIQACSPDPGRYQAVVLSVAEWVLASGGPANTAEINETLAEAYPAWFGASCCQPVTLYKRLSRARQSVRLVLAAVVDRDELLP